MLVVSKYDNTCCSCNISFKSGQGFAFKDSVDEWQPICAALKCIEQEIPEEIENYKALMDKMRVRCIQRDGTVIMPYSKENYQLLEAMPGAEYLPEIKSYKISTNKDDRLRVLELAEKLQLDHPWKDEEIRPRWLQNNITNTPSLFDYQAYGVSWIGMKNRCLVADDQGLGKTVEILMALDPSMGVMVVAPTHLTLNWKDEASKWRPDLEVIVLKNGKEFIYPEPGQMVILSYGLLPWWLELPPKKRKNLMVEPEEHKVAKNMILVFDEIQAIKNNKSKQGRKSKFLSKMAGKVIGATGTPIMNRPTELWNILSAIRIEKEAFGDYMGFLRAFRAKKNKFNAFEFGDPRPETGEMLRRVMLRRLKSEVEIELPSKRFIEIPVDSPKKYQKLFDDSWDLYRKSNFFEKEELPTIEELSKTKKILAESKIKHLKELVSDFEEKGTIPIVFSAHKKPIEELGKRKGWAAIHGGMTSKQKHRIVKEFQEGKYKGLAANILSAGTGFTLTKTNVIIFNDLDWTPANNEQAQDRVARIGQKEKNALYYYLVADHPLDRHMHKLILKKMELASFALDQKIEPVKNIDVDQSMSDTKEMREKRISDEETSEQKIRCDAILSRIPAWIERNNVKLTNKTIDAERADDIRAKLEVLENIEENSMRILRLLKVSGLQTQEELKFAESFFEIS